MRAPGRSQARKRGERVLRKLLYADSYAIRNDVVHIVQYSMRPLRNTNVTRSIRADSALLSLGSCVSAASRGRSVSEMMRRASCLLVLLAALQTESLLGVLDAAMKRRRDTALTARVRTPS